MGETMRVARCTGYGGPEKVVIEDHPIPTPRPDEVLVRLAATTVSSADVRIRAFNLPGASA